MYKVMVKEPAKMISPVYLNKDIEVSTIDLDSMKGALYLFRKRYCSTI